MVSIKGTPIGVYIRYIDLLREHHITHMKILLLKKENQVESSQYKRLVDYHRDIKDKMNTLREKAERILYNDYINKRLHEIDLELESLGEDELINGIRERNEIYYLLKEKTNLLKYLDKHKYKIGVVLYLLSKIEDEEIKGTILNAILSIDKSDVVDSLDVEDAWINTIFEILQEEGKIRVVKIDDELLIVPKDKYEDVAKIYTDYIKISNNIQFKNAEKQVRRFDQTEQEEFEKLQKEYLELLSKLNEIKRSYSDYEIPDNDNAE